MERLEKNKLSIFIGVGVTLLITLLLIDMLVGMSDVGLKDILKTFISFDGSKEALIIKTIRFPRGLLCILVGASMALAGLFIQNITRNPIASPKVLGVNAGATLAVVIIMVFFPEDKYNIRILVAFLGAGVISIAVQLIGRVRNLSPLKITLVGITIQMFLASVTKAIMLFNDSKTSELVFWMVGAVHQAQFTHVIAILPWFVIAIILGLIISKSMDVLKMGDRIAISLGENINRTKFIGLLVVIILAGSSVAVAGPISFLGLITPHIVSKMKVNNVRGSFILCGIYGANLLLLSDIVSKLIKYPYESPVGIVTSFLGAVFYIFIASREIKRGGAVEK